MNVTDRVFRKRIEDKFPAVASTVTEKPMLEDVTTIDKIFQLYCKVISLSEKPKSSEVLDFRTLFVALVLKCYDPDYMNGYRKKVRNGVRPQIADILKIDSTDASKLFALAKGRVRIYKSMADSVDRLYKLVRENIE